MFDLDAHVDATRWFIGWNPSPIAFRRKVKAPDGAGGVKVISEVTLNAQTCRVVGTKGTPLRMTPDGRQIIINAHVIGTPDLDVQIGDFFTHQNREYEIVGISDGPAWRVDVEATLRGSS